MEVSRRCCCTVQITAALKWPTSILVSAEQGGGCLGCCANTFVPVVCITVPPHRWKMLSGWTWENPDAEVRADFQKLAAMGGEGRRVKIKVKCAQKTIAKRVLFGSDIFDITEDGDFVLDNSPLRVAPFESLTLWLKRKQFRTEKSEGHARERHVAVADSEQQSGDADASAPSSEESGDAAGLAPPLAGEEESSEGNVFVPADERVSRDISLWETADRVRRRDPPPVAGTSDCHEELPPFPLPDSFKSPATRWPGKGRTHRLPSASLSPPRRAPSTGTSPLLLWTASLTAVCFCATLVPLLPETVPFLPGKFSRSLAVTPLLQALCAALLLSTTVNLYVAQYSRRSRQKKDCGKWC